MTRLPCTLLALLAPACIPAHAAYRALPIDTLDGAPRQGAVVAVRLDALEQRLEHYDPDALAFYERGREPLPFRLVDRDGDGTADTALVRVDVEADPRQRLTVICPGPTATGEPPDGPPTPGVVVHYR